MEGGSLIDYPDSVVRKDSSGNRRFSQFKLSEQHQLQPGGADYRVDFGKQHRGEFRV